MTTLRHCLLVAGFAWFIASPVAAQQQEAAGSAGFPDKKEPEWSQYGALVKTDLICEDGQPVYALRDGDKLITYVATMKGKFLDGYVGFMISVYGPTMDLPKGKAKYVLASHVAVGAEFVEVKTRNFALPIEINEKQIEETEALRIFVSENRGKTWKQTRECKPTEKRIEFLADRDDIYWFAIQVIKKDGTVSPAEEKDLVPVLKVNVNTTGKAIKLEASNSASPVAAQESWVGKTVLTKRDGIKLSVFDDKGHKVKDEAVVGFGQQVLDEKLGCLAIRNGLGATGWISKADAVRVEDAVAFFTECIQQNPKDAFALTCRGTVLIGHQKFDDALKDLDAAIRLDPNNVGAYRSRAGVWQHKNDVDRVIADLNEAIRLDPRAYALKSASLDERSWKSPHPHLSGGPSRA